MRGTLLIADISGYTAFLTGSELEHAQDILDSLVLRLIEQLQPPLRIAKLEGDAIFCAAPDGTFGLGQSLLEVVENAYAAFCRERLLIGAGSTCTCRACRNTPSLGLKFVVHHGEWLERDLDGRRELSGPDVIAVHRLLKNTVVEATGIQDYAFYSDACVTALSLDEAVAALPRHEEVYDHLGPVAGRVADLGPVWTDRQQQPFGEVRKDQAWIQVTGLIRTTPHRVWEYLNDPTQVPRWNGATSFTISGKSGGRMGRGTVQHCAHGKHKTDMRLVDWRPFESMTVESTGPFGTTFHWSARLVPQDGGTYLTLYSTRPAGKGRWHDWLVRPFIALIRPLFQKMWQDGGTKMGQLAVEDVISGRALPPPERASRADLVARRPAPEPAVA